MKTTTKTKDVLHCSKYINSLIVLQEMVEFVSSTSATVMAV